MKKLLMTLSLLLTLGLSASAVAAQTDGVEVPDLEEAAATAYDVEGLQSVYDRTFTVDFETMMASPDEDPAGIDMSAMMNVISIQGITFDSDDNASAYIDQMKDELETSVADDPDAFSDTEISDLDGFDVEGIRVHMDMADLGIAASVIIFVDGNQVYQVMVMDSDIDVAQSKADDVTRFVLDAEVGNEEVSFDEDGTSTGGVFDRMPTGDDDIVGDLTSVLDSEIIVTDEN